MTDKKDLAPDGRPKMVVGKSFWEILERSGEDMRFYRLNPTSEQPFRSSMLFRTI